MEMSQFLFVENERLSNKSVNRDDQEKHILTFG